MEKKINLEDFKNTLTQDQRPEDLHMGLQSLWEEGKGNWEAAHGITNEMGDEIGAWVHAYLHRVEGDLSNAAYWYRRAKRPVSTAPLPQEWDEIASFLLNI